MFAPLVDQRRHRSVLEIIKTTTDLKETLHRFAEQIFPVKELILLAAGHVARVAPIR